MRVTRLNPETLPSRRSEFSFQAVTHFALFSNRFSTARAVWIYRIAAKQQTEDNIEPDHES